MTSDSFPLQTYMRTFVQLLDTIEYKDSNYETEKRIARLKYVYDVSADHFSDPERMRILGFKQEKIGASVIALVNFSVCAWPECSPEAQADIAIYWTYALLLDDTPADISTDVNNFCDNLFDGKEKFTGWWKLMQDFMPKLLRHYDKFCSLTITRSTMDFFQGRWIEQHNFQGFPGSNYFPLYLRQLTSLGQSAGALLFPASVIDEAQHFEEIVSAICHMEKWFYLANDIISFYKEHDDPTDENSLVHTFARCDQTTLTEALEKVMSETLTCTDRLVKVFADKDPVIVNILQRLVSGYITWHLLDPRYRLDELVVRAGDTEDAKKLRAYMEQAKDVGGIDKKKWIKKPFFEFVKEKQGSQPLDDAGEQCLDHVHPAATPVSFISSKQ